MRIIVPPSIQANRLAICHDCKFFVKSTGSCGTLLLGGTTGTHYRKKIKLCGCVMRVKTKFSLASCPAEKWLRWSGKDGSAQLTDLQLTQLKTFMDSIHGRSSLQSAEVQELVKWANRVSVQPVPYTTCAPCVRDMITELKRAIKEA